MAHLEECYIGVATITQVTQVRDKNNSIQGRSGFSAFWLHHCVRLVNEELLV